MKIMRFKEDYNVEEKLYHLSDLILSCSPNAD